MLLTGASGSMGFEAFKLLWEKRDRYDIVLLLRPSKKNRKLFRKYETEAGAIPSGDGGAIPVPGNAMASGEGPVSGSRVVGGNGLKIVWGDVLNRKDVEEACRGIDWCLHCLALISPAADRNPHMAWKVNVEGTRAIVEAIEEQDPDHIRMVYISSVAVYGERLPPLHVGRTGDPVIPSIYDNYAISKINAELAVMQFRIRHRVTLRQTFIMIPQLFSLMDPIMFHQSINSFMENITVRDSGRLLISCLDVPGDSGFWGGYYNVSGGKQCRTTFLALLESIYNMLGIRYRKAMKRNWFALKNFHMVFFEDAALLDAYLHHWEGAQSQQDFYRLVWKTLPWYLKSAALFARLFPPFRWLMEAATYDQLRRLAGKPEGTLHWIRNGDEGRINAFFGSREAYEKIPGWDDRMPDLDIEQGSKQLDHGYDESKDLPGRDDLEAAAAFRGGSLESNSWPGDMHDRLSWRCCQGHLFEMTPHAVLKGGHWCLECIAPPWNYTPLVKGNPFAAQVLSAPG